jgi:hypothetical protein
MNWIMVAIGAVPAFALSILLHMLDVNGLEDKHRDALAEQHKTLTEQCLSDKAKTQELVDALQAKNDSDGRLLATLKLRKSTKCVMPSTATAPKHDGTTATVKPAGENGGVTVDSLLDYAADSEKYASQLDTCQKFIRDVWKSNNQ